MPAEALAQANSAVDENVLFPIISDTLMYGISAFDPVIQNE
jgi:hypothetical protein